MPDSQLELGFPIGDVSASCTAEKSIRNAHISTMQQWFARRPLAICRAALFLALAPDEQEVEKSEAARRILDAWAPEQANRVKQLQKFAGRLSRWDSAADAELVGAARELLAAGRSRRPVVVDTFAGGGSIPVEALRLDLDSFASDLHPTPVLALRAMMEHLPGRPDLVDRFEQAGAECSNDIRERIGRLYANGAAKPLAFFWARTYPCPNCGLESPLFRDRWLARGRRRIVVEVGHDSDDRLLATPCELSSDSDSTAGAGNVSRKGARCLKCDSLVSTAYLRSKGMSGDLGEWLYAKLVRGADGSKRYLAADPTDVGLAAAAKPQWENSALVPATPLDLNGIRHTWAMQYGVATIADLHTKRQAQALDETLGILIERSGGGEDDAGLTLLTSLAFNRLIPYSTRHTWWQANGQFPANMYSRQAIPMVWDFVEIPISSPGAAGWQSAVKWIAAAARHMSKLPRKGKVVRTDAGSTPLESGSVDVVAIDPPYFDSVAYSYLAEPFIAWSHDLVAPLYGSEVAPTDVSTHEAIVDRKHSLAPASKDPAHFAHKIEAALIEANRVLRDDGLLVVMYGHKELEAWESLLGAATNSGFAMTASWPLRTERKAKFRHSHVNALGGSCLLTFRRSQQPRARLRYEAFESELERTLSVKQTEFVGHGVEGPDLAAALAVLSMGFFAAHDVVDQAGQGISLSSFVPEIPPLISRLQERLARSDPLLVDLRPLLEQSSLEELILEATPSQPIAHLARSYVDAAQAEQWLELDSGWALEVGAERKAAALAVLRYAALSEDSSSDLKQSAEIVLGRFALHSTALRDGTLGNGHEASLASNSARVPAHMPDRASR